MLAECEGTRDARMHAFPSLAQPNAPDPLTLMLAELPLAPFDPTPLIAFLNDLNLYFSI